MNSIYLKYLNTEIFSNNISLYFDHFIVSLTFLLNKMLKKKFYKKNLVTSTFWTVVHIVIK